MTLLELDNVTRAYRAPGGLFAPRAPVLAVAGISLTLDRGHTLALVGESGCGKSTTGRLALGLETPDSGSVSFDGAAMPKADTKPWRTLRARLQLVFQDPLGALDRHMPIIAQVTEPLAVHGRGTKAEQTARGHELLNAVGLRADHGAHFPHELSGGQRQRVVLARALASKPDLLVCDEPVSALDVSVQAQVVNLLADLKAELHLAMLFISHDLKLVRILADEVAVMYLGLIVEQGEPDALYAEPAHPYTQALLASIPDLSRRGRRMLIAGEPPDPAARPSGCSFHPRCPVSVALCRAVSPLLKRRGDGRMVACHVANGDAATQAPLHA